MASIEMKNIVKKYGDGFPAVNDVSLDIADGEFMILVGPSGCGKSTVLKMLGGLIAPTSGEIRLRGDSQNGPTPEIGIVYQQPLLLPWRTVLDNVMIPVEVLKLPKSEYRAKARDLLDLLGLADFEKSYPHQLSGGMQQRVGIARAIALRPRYILYDEPTTGLDPVTSAVMDQLMIRTRDLGVTGLVVTHDMRSAFAVGDRIAMLYDGAIRQVGSVAEIQATEDPVVRQFIEGRPGEATPAPAGRAAQ